MSIAAMQTSVRLQTPLGSRSTRQPCQTHVPDCGPSCRSARRGPELPVHRSRQTVRPRALGAADAQSLISGTTQAAWLAAIGMGLAWFASEVLGQAEKVSDEERCATCGGTGVVDCMCTRWSDDDVGCGSCAGSGKSTCRSCGGGGTRVPVTANLYAHRSRGPLE